MGDLVDRHADALDLGLARHDLGFRGRSGGGAVGGHGGGEAALGIADRIERAVERQPVEIVRDHDGARRAHDVIEPEERLGREIGGGDRGDILAGAVGDHDDIGRGEEP
jgi:hypothetical protein